MNARAAIGYYEMVGGTAGIALTVYAALRGSSLPGDSVRIALAPFAALIVAGWRLRRGGPGSRWPSVAMQLVQILFFSIAGYGWKFTGGLLVSVGIVGTRANLFAGLDASLITAWRATDQSFVIGLNLAPIVLLIMLARLKQVEATTGPHVAPAPAA